MDSIQRFGQRLNSRFLIWGLVIWWLAMIVGYSLISLRADHLKDKISQSGIKISQEFSNLVSLPLLEKKDQTILSLLTDAANRKDVIYASVVDHRNKVVAFTGTGHLLPDVTKAARSVEQVSIWEGGFASHAKILNFASDVTYSGTKIGELFIGLSTTETFGLKSRYLIAAVVSCLVLLSIIAVFRYPAIRSFLGRFSDYLPSKPAMDSNLKESLIQCPFCGTQKHFSEKLFKQSNRDRFLTIKAAKPGSNADTAEGFERIDLRDLIHKEDLTWLRRAVILRCTEIIKKLAA
ncbi:MAG: hypothetical protein KJO34_18335 [Deltaproteobacteria bacterium]|nr:hypothetical protein [Deltaproteobacteria bacterium]